MGSITDMIQMVASNVWFYGGIFIVVLSILVFVHEWGHYIVARICGVKVETFSIGFGKELFGRNDKHGTRWKVSLIPLGGYVKMFGDVDPASAGHSDGVKDGEKVRPFTTAEKKEAFFAKPVAQRAAIVIAGPAINFIFAIIILAGMYGFHGQPVTPPMASAVIAGSAADKAGIEPHDEIVSIAGEKVKRFEDIRRIVMVALDTPLPFKIIRDGEEIELTATPKKEQLTDRFGFTHSRGLLGIVGPSDGIAIKNVVAVNDTSVKGADEARKALMPVLGQRIDLKLLRGKTAEGEDRIDTLIVKAPVNDNKGLNDETSETYGALVVSGTTNELLRHGVVGSLGAAVNETWSITTSTLKALGQMFTGTRSATELGGIVRIGAIAGDMAQMGILAIITFTALLSINLGLINLFPIPMLDGGHLMFYAIEAIKGKPVSEKIQDYAFRAGFAVLISMMLFANLNDLYQLFDVKELFK